MQQQQHILLQVHCVVRVCLHAETTSQFMRGFTKGSYRLLKNTFPGVIDNRSNKLEISTNVHNTLSRSISVLNKAKHVLDHISLHILYCALIWTYLNYCAKVWGNTYKCITIYVAKKSHKNNSLVIEITQIHYLKNKITFIFKAQKQPTPWQY